MPTIGSFHAKFWNSHWNTAPQPPGTGNTWTYPAWQSVVTTMHASVIGLPLTAIAPMWNLVKEMTRRKPATPHAPADPLAARLEGLTPEQRAVVVQVLDAFDHPHWPQAETAVRAAAAVPKGHTDAAWQDTRRAIKGDADQVVHLWRHVSAVQRFLEAVPNVSDRTARLLIELAYQAFAVTGRPKRIIEHQKVVQ